MKDNVLFAPKVPLCRYAALFDGRPMFDAIRVAFMRVADPTMTLNTFTDSLKKLVDQARRVIFGAPCVLACMLSLQQRAPRQVVLYFSGNLRGCAERKTFVGSSLHLVILSLCSASGAVRAEDIGWMLFVLIFSRFDTVELVDLTPSRLLPKFFISWVHVEVGR
jgi:hypothetical protein